MTDALPGGFRVLRLGAVASTNDVARGLAEAGEPAGLVVVAERQTAGRGRHGRGWESPPGNLHASLLLRPAKPLREVASLSLVVALLLAETVEALAGGRVRPRVKWPNDVLVDGAKLAGILLEGAADGEGACRWLVVGIGVNVRTSPGGRLGHPTTDLVRCGLEDAGPEALLAALAPRLREGLDAWAAEGFAPFRERWLARAFGLGEPIELRAGSGVERGTLAGVDGDGAVLLRRPTGELDRFAAGELVLAGAPA